MPRGWLNQALQFAVQSFEAKTWAVESIETSVHKINQFCQFAKIWQPSACKFFIIALVSVYRTRFLRKIVSIGNENQKGFVLMIEEAHFRFPWHVSRVSDAGVMPDCQPPPSSDQYTGLAIISSPPLHSTGVTLPTSPAKPAAATATGHTCQEAGK